MSTERLQKILARGGLASRRAAETLITEGRVRVNGKIVTELGTKADPRNDKIEVDGKKVVAESPVYYVLHKPRGYVTTLFDPEGRPTIKDLLRRFPDIESRVFPVGRLDYATSGTLLLTNDGAFSDGLLHPRQAVPKTYVVKVVGVMKPEDIERWRSGVQLEDGKTLPAEAQFLRFEGTKTWIEITIREGRNQQIRRMGDATGFRVMRLARASFAGVTVESLRPGDIRPLTYEELVEMKKLYGVPRSPKIAHGMEPLPTLKRAAKRGDVPEVRDARTKVGEPRAPIARDDDRRGNRGRNEARPSHARSSSPDAPPARTRSRDDAPPPRTRPSTSRSREDLPTSRSRATPTRSRDEAPQRSPNPGPRQRRR